VPRKFKLLDHFGRPHRFDLNSYRFRSVWRIDAAANDVLAVLEATEDYPAWWPEVRRVEMVDNDLGRMVVRSLLPYDLVFDTRQSRLDRGAGVLEVTMTGDLEGFSRWTVQPSGAGSVAVFEEQVTAVKPLLRRLAAVARPAFRANHWLMMKHGCNGLQTYLAGYACGRQAAAGKTTGAEARPA
jgi:hypothetical protein